MVEVFQTNVEQPLQAEKLVALLLQHFPGSKINFDLDDCDRILRVEKNYIRAEEIVELMAAEGYKCLVLE